MREMEQIYRSLPDIFIITDAYWYVLDFNHSGHITGLKRGIKLTHVMDDLHNMEDYDIQYGDVTYRRRITSIYNKQVISGYTVYLEDITEEVRLMEETRQKSLELKALVEQQRAANAELEAYADQIRRLSEYSEQLRIARDIHDDSGHAITALHAISQMCLKLQARDRASFDAYIAEGLAICEQGLKEPEHERFTSLQELLRVFKNECQMAVEVTVSGDEPAYVQPLYGLLIKVFREAYHNTLAHSLADRLMIMITMDERELAVEVEDNGAFHGVFEKGFGLHMLEDNVVASGGTVSFRTETGKGFGIIMRWRKSNE